MLGFLCSNLSTLFTGIFSPTLNVEAGAIGQLPFLTNAVSAKSARLSEIVGEIVHIAKNDWDACERSWDFESIPLLSAPIDSNQTLESSFHGWILNNKQNISDMKRLEEENNRLFIDTYDL